MSADNTAVNYRFGVRGVKLALQTAAGTYGTPWHEKGCESLTENRAERSVQTFHSDDGNVQNASGVGGNDTMEATFAEFSEDYNTKILGHKIDATTGATIKSKDDEGATFAIGYELQGTQGKTRIWKVGCTSSEPSMSANQTNGDGVTEAPQTCTITIGGDTFSTGDAYEMVSHEGEAGFDTFLDAVPVPNPSEGAVNLKLSALTVGSLTLTPAFNPLTTTYAASTTASSAAVTATAEDNTATVAISVGGSSVTSGTSVDLSVGQNVITVLVSKSGATRAYTVIVTRTNG